MHGRAGIVNSVYLDNDNDERLECSATGQICYLSAVICECKTKEVVAPLYHASLCKCPVSRKCFVFWHRMADLDSIIQHLRYRIHLVQGGSPRAMHGPMVRPTPLAASHRHAQMRGRDR